MLASDTVACTRTYIVERMPRFTGSRCGVNTSRDEFSSCQISGACRCLKTLYALKLSVTSEKCVPAVGDLPAPLTPDFESQMMSNVSSMSPDCCKGMSGRRAEVG